MKEAGVWKKQLLSSQNGRACLGRSVLVAERQKKYKICLSCLPLSEIMCSSKHIYNSGHQKVFESAYLTVEHVTHWALPCSSNLMFIYCIEQCQFPVGARAPSDTVPHPAGSEYSTCKDPKLPPLFKVENTLKYCWILILYSLFQVWNHPWFAPELFLWV